MLFIIFPTPLFPPFRFGVYVGVGGEQRGFLNTGLTKGRRRFRHCTSLTPKRRKWGKRVAPFKKGANNRCPPNSKRRWGLHKSGEHCVLSICDACSPPAFVKIWVLTLSVSQKLSLLLENEALEEHLGSFRAARSARRLLRRPSKRKIIPKCPRLSLSQPWVQLLDSAAAKATRDRGCAIKEMNNS